MAESKIKKLIIEAGKVEITLEDGNVWALHDFPDGYLEDKVGSFLDDLMESTDAGKERE